MKQCAIVVLTLIFALNLAQASTADLFQKYSKLSALTSQFAQVKEVKSLGVKLNSKGTLSFKKPDYFEWKVTSPKSFGFVFNKGGIEFWENGKMTRSADTSKMDSKMLNAVSHLKAWLTMDQKFIETHYAVKQINASTYEFTPVGDLKIFKKIEVETHEKYPIKKITMYEMSDDLITITFTDTKLTYEK